MSQRLVSPLIVSTTEGVARMQMLANDTSATEKVGHTAVFWSVGSSKLKSGCLQNEVFKRGSVTLQSDQVLEECKCRIDVQGGSWKAIVRGTLKKGAMEVEDQPWTPRRWKKGPKTCRYSQETKRKRIYTEAFWERGRRTRSSRTTREGKAITTP